MQPATPQPIAPTRVLVVDDHPPTRRLIRAVLEAESFVVEEAASGADGLRMADVRSPFDLVLLDVNLPDMGGFAVGRALRSVYNHIPIVFLSTHSDLASFQAKVAASGDSYLAKPVDRRALAAAARSFARTGPIEKTVPAVTLSGIEQTPRVPTL
jgi:DNA-binding response OmpR family regulator